MSMWQLRCRACGKEFGPMAVLSPTQAIRHLLECRGIRDGETRTAAIGAIKREAVKIRKKYDAFNAANRE